MEEVRPVRLYVRDHYTRLLGPDDQDEGAVRRDPVYFNDSVIFRVR